MQRIIGMEFFGLDRHIVCGREGTAPSTRLKRYSGLAVHDISLFAET
jgi:hypothetical protein